VIVGVGVVGAAGGEAQVAPSSLPSATVAPFTPQSTTATVTPSSTATVPPVEVPALTQTLRDGMVSSEVQQVQERLHDLGFDPGPADGIYGLMTKQAVWAFEKLVLQTPRTEATGQIDADAWQTLFNDVTITPRRSTSGQANHTEVYLPEQVMIVFHADVPVLISHISTGEVDVNGQPIEYCEEATYDTDAQGRELEEPVTKAICALAKTPGGVFSYDRQVEGKRVSPLGGMWNPVYFNYGIAVHGALEVPNEPASHGCVRIPMHISDYFQDTISIGDRILVWNGVDEPENVSERESLPSFDYPDPSVTTTTSTTVPETTTTTSTTTTTTLLTDISTTSPPTTPSPTTTSTVATTSTTSGPPTSKPATTTTTSVDSGD
jgi:hypothetical protein